MPLMSVQSLSVGANALSANIFAGKPFEFIQRPSIVRIYACSSAVGMNATVTCGNRTIVQDEPYSQANRFPIKPDDLLIEFPGLPGERLVMQLRNTTAGALTNNVQAEIIEVR